MDRNKIKSDVLQELIDLMESKEVEGLKSHSPKFAKIEIEANEIPEEPLDDRSEELENMKRIKEFKGDVQDKHMDMADPMGKFKDPFKQSHMDLPKEDEDEDLERLKELYSKLK